MRGSEKDTAVGFVFANDVGRRGRRQNSVLPDDELGYAVGGCDLQNDLHHFRRVVAPIASDDQGRAREGNGIENCLNKVFGVVLSE